MKQLPASIFEFLKAVAKNNNRDWFAENKPQYKAQHEIVKAWANELFEKMQAYDHLEAVKVFRIYRDVRFSKNKLPYKTNFALSLTRATTQLRGGIYVHLEPGNSFIGGGFWDPSSPDLKRIRQELAVDGDTFRDIINSKEITEVFGEMQGDQLKTSPRDYDKDHPQIELLRYKQYLFMRNFTDGEVLASDFMEKVIDSFRRLRPFYDYMSNVLTTDANGVPIEPNVN